MSLMDLLQSKDPAVQNGLLNFGLSLLQSKGNFGNAVGRAGQVGQIGARDFRQQQALMQRAALNDELIKNQLEQQQQQMALQRLPGQFVKPPSQPGIDATGGMETAMENPANAAGPGGVDLAGLANAYMGAPGGLPMGLQLQQMLQKQAPQLQAFKPGDVVGTNVGGKFNEQFRVPEKPSAESVQPSAVREYQFAVTQGFKGTFQEWKKANAPAGTTNVVSVNTGQKGLDNTLKLRGDFRSEPVYKAHQEMQSAYAQIKQSLKQASPAGDLAGATKIMKLLDPGSVVRESELGMAMAASGLMDRMQNYASMVMSGTKLTPTQRKDFQTLADALYGESVKQYNSKRKEYEGIASRNGLSVPDVLGAESTAPTKAVEWSIVKVP